MQQRTPEDVQTALEALNLKTEVQFHSTVTATAQQAADTIGCPLGAIVKSLCFIVNGQPHLVLCAGDRRVDDRALGAYLGISRKRCKIDDYETTIQVTGYSPGGVPPIGHSESLPVLIDASLERFEMLWAAAGAANAVFSVTSQDLVRITGGTVIALSRNATG